MALAFRHIPSSFSADARCPGSYSGNYICLVLILAIYSLLTNPLLLIAIGFLAGGFLAITRFITEDVQFGSTTITQKNLYTALMIIGLPMLWFAGEYLVDSSLEPRGALRG